MRVCLWLAYPGFLHEFIYDYTASSLDTSGRKLYSPGIYLFTGGLSFGHCLKRIITTQMPVPVYCNRQSSINSTLKYALSRESALSPGSAYSCESRDSYSLLNLQPRDGIVDSEFKYEVEGTCSGTVPNWQDGGFCHGSRGRLPTRNSYEISKQNRDTISPIFSSIREVASPRGDSSSFMHLIGIDGITKFDAENDNIRVWEFLGDFDTEMLFSRNVSNFVHILAF